MITASARGRAYKGLKAASQAARNARRSGKLCRVQTQRAFVLSGGASLGAIQVGMLRALFERDIAPDLLVGTSVGALNGAYIASRDPSLTTVEGLATLWRGLRRSRIFPINPLTELFGVLGTRNHLVPNSGLRRLLREQLNFARLEDARTPLHIITTDLYTGAERRLSRGDAQLAVLASSALPGVFAPVDWEDTELIDGGVANNAPISHAVELGATEVYVLSTGYSCALAAPPRGALATAVHAVGLLVQQRLITDIMRVSDDVRLVVLPPPCPLSVQPTDFTQADELMQRAHENACRFLDDQGPSGTTRLPPSLHADQLV